MNSRPSTWTSSKSWYRQDSSDEWLIERATAERNYGAAAIASLGTDFTSHRKVATVGMIPLDRTVLDLLGEAGSELAFFIPWSDCKATSRAVRPW